MRENLVRHTRSCDAGSRRSVVNGTLAIGRLCRLALVLSVLGLGVFLGWGIWWWLAASQRGLDLSDESLYILMAERPRSYLQAPWQAHQLWGVVLDAVGTVQRLRIARIALLLSAHLVLARSFLSAFPSLGIPDMQRAGRSVVVAAVAAGAFLPAVWLPQTPGYNDMAVQRSHLPRHYTYRDTGSPGCGDIRRRCRTRDGHNTLVARTRPVTPRWNVQYVKRIHR